MSSPYRSPLTPLAESKDDFADVELESPVTKFVIDFLLTFLPTIIFRLRAQNVAEKVGK
jgi:hypothetical protein